MTMTRTGAGMKISTALVALAVLLSAAKCEAERTGSVDTDRNPADRAVDPALARTVTIRASIREAKGVPGEVTVGVYESNGDHETSHEILTVAGGEYVQTLMYSTGTRLTIHVEVKPSKPLSGAFCEVVDGETVTRFGPVMTSWRALCDTVTTQ